ncbi:MAG: IS3 family transposase [Ignavibacteria bacterium]|nr:IS3 family transposase [Ignavibacteria bacterium]
MYKLIKENTPRFEIKNMCDGYNIPRCSYYSWLNRGISKRKREDMYYAERIASVFEENNRIYGSPRITADLRTNGLKIGRNRVFRLMKIQGLSGDRKKKRRIIKNTSSSNEPAAENLVKRNFDPENANELWAGDISNIETKEGVMYLSVVLDLWSRAVIGWELQSSMTENLVIRSLIKAIKNRNPKAELIVHTDQGSQFRSVRYKHLLSENNLIQSMSYKGNCYDNAAVESFFASLKKELVYRMDFRTKEEARSQIYKYIEIFYNRKRRHSRLGYLSPLNFEKLKNTTF